MNEPKAGAGRVVDIVGSVLLLSMILLALTNIIGDWIFNRKYGQIDELVTILFVWVVYVSVGELYKTDEHIRVVLLEKLISRKAGRILATFNNAIILLVSLAVTYYGILLALRSVTKYTPILRVQYTYIGLPIILGFAVSIVYVVRNIWTDVRELRRK